MKRSLLLGCISLFVVAVFAQEDPVLMRVNGYGFHRVYDYSASRVINTKVYGMYKPLFMRKK